MSTKPGLCIDYPKDILLKLIIGVNKVYKGKRGALQQLSPVM
jgi:hypothetical protein